MPTDYEIVLDEGKGKNRLRTAAGMREQLSSELCAYLAIERDAATIRIAAKRLIIYSRNELLYALGTNLRFALVHLQQYPQAEGAQVELISRQIGVANIILSAVGASLKTTFSDLGFELGKLRKALNIIKRVGANNMAAVQYIATAADELIAVKHFEMTSIENSSPAMVEEEITMREYFKSKGIRGDDASRAIERMEKRAKARGGLKPVRAGSKAAPGKSGVAARYSRAYLEELFTLEQGISGESEQGKQG